MDLHKILQIGALLSGAALSWCFVNLIAKYKKRRKLTIKRRQKRRELSQSLLELKERVEGTVSPEVVEHVSQLGTLELLDKLRTGNLRPLQVLRIFQVKALEAHEKSNCLVEVIKEAEQWAIDLEEQPEKAILYGLPIAIKDDIDVQGYDTTVGCSCYIDKPADCDADVVKVLKEQGAIPFVKTNVPQLAASFHTSNPIYGITVNALDQSRTSGGSSGGSAALVAASGLPVAMGSDLAGSIRIPAFLNGVCGFKPTSGRVSLRGSPGGLVGSVIQTCSFGPIAKDVDGVILVTKALLSDYMFEQNLRICNTTFNESLLQDKRRLRIGYFTDNGVMLPLPPCQRAVHLAVTMLQEKGHSVVPYSPVHLPILYQALSLTFFGDGGQAFLELLENDQVDRLALGYFDLLYSLPRWLRLLVVKMWSIKNPALGEFLKPADKTRDVYKMWNVMAFYEGVIDTFSRHWNEHKLDAVICPVSAVTPMPKDFEILSFNKAGSYTCVFNALNYPAGTVPVTTISEEDFANLNVYPVVDEASKDAKSGMVGSLGMPVGVQVVTPPWRDERCLGLMKELEECLHARSSAH